MKLFLYFSFYIIFLYCNDINNINDINIVISAIGGPDIDGDREDITWIQRNLTKKIYIYHSTKNIQKNLYQRNKYIKLNYLGNINNNNNDCLSYLKYIYTHYNSLPSVILFMKSDAPRRCPTIRSIIDKPSNELHSLINDPRRKTPGYASLTRVLLNQSETYLREFNLPMVDFVNKLTLERCEYLRQINNENGDTQDPCEGYVIVNGYPHFITTYLSHMFAVSRENILKYPYSFYKNMFNKILNGNQYDTTCGMLEYLWSNLWGGVPFENEPDYDRLCGPLYYTDLASTFGFLFYKSEDGSLEKSGVVPLGYNGYVMNPELNKYPTGYKGYHKLDIQQQLIEHIRQEALKEAEEEQKKQEQQQEQKEQKVVEEEKQPEIHHGDERTEL